MLKEVIDYNREFGINGVDSKKDNYNEFMYSVKGFYEAETTEGRLFYLLESMFCKLLAMVNCSYNGEEFEDKKYNSTMDILINVVQNELGDDYLRVLPRAEKIITNNRLGITTSGAKAVSNRPKPIKLLASLIKDIKKSQEK